LYLGSWASAILIRRTSRPQSLTKDLTHPFSISTRLLALAYLVTATTFAADAPKLPAIPEGAIAKKRELLFSDDFERAELGKAWAVVIPTFSIEKGALKGTQMRSDTVAVVGQVGTGGVKPAMKGH